MSFLKMHPILFSLLVSPMISHGENSDGPAKFYDDLPIKPKPKANIEDLPPLYHTIKANESLFTVAAHYGYSYVELARWNDIGVPYTVVVGQKLKLFNDKELDQLVDKEINRPADIQNQTEDLNKLPLSHGEESASTTEAAQKVVLNIAACNYPPRLNESYEVENYIVGENESLSTIASRFGVAPEPLAAWNNITSPNQIYAGQKLKIFKNKQKHSLPKFSKKREKIDKNVRDNAQKTSIISINNKNMLKFYYHWPTEGKVVRNFSQTNGAGIEISGKVGQAIRAIAAGTVVAVGPRIYGHGSFIVIQHDNQYLSSYTNNRRSFVTNNQRVKQGQIIAEMGKVIGSKLPSLKFAIRKNGKLVNPMQFY